eukprot:8473424-Pyramimonas_sp.AAC.1
MRIGSSVCTRGAQTLGRNAHFPKKGPYLKATKQGSMCKPRAGSLPQPGPGTTVFDVKGAQ